MRLRPWQRRVRAADPTGRHLRTPHDPPYPSPDDYPRAGSASPPREMLPKHQCQ